jgi:hypothetical protein
MLHYTRWVVGLSLAAAILASSAAGIAQAQAMLVERAMPAPLVEAAPPPPRVGVAWVPGHWVWRGNEWFWARGHYVEGLVPAMPAAMMEAPPPRPSPAHFWVRGHWGWESGRWNWRPGLWFHP